MQTRTQTIVAALTALAAGVNGHIIMKSPAPFGSVGSTKSITSSPLTSAQYPCQVGSDPATFYSKEGLDNKMTIGETQTISFTGSAVHGGGSCQLALTKDPQPSASTSWQVILSIEGGCPSKSGTGTDTYDFTIPDSIEPGDWVFAWTWISKLSGTQEYYMNCAPVTISGGSGKRDVYHNETMELYSRDSTLPELMVSNLAGINDCKSTLSTDPTYPNPGSIVQKPGTSNSFAPITGSNCVPKGLKDGASGSGSGSNSGSSSSAAASSAATSAATSAASSAASSATSAAATSAATSASSGFVTVTIATSSLSVATSSAAASSAAATSSATTASSAPASGSSSSPSSGSGSSAQGLTGACTTEGMFNCIDGTSYQQCASGSWSVVQSMPATTKCAPGQTMTLWARDLPSDKNKPQMRRRGY
ncbi:hypothetical protein F5Y03DRAFT_116891 [Xylaria venustula]|nr:hypothetical protein F5Y03DRAFT_116891 [Xylaria venustula]